jgi:signal transduction histidine kinase/CheY-like chemotaxis protein
MSHEPQESTFYQEMRDEMRRRALALTTIGSVVLGQLVVIVSELHRFGSNASLAGILISLLPLAMWLSLGRRQALCLSLMTLFYIALPLAVWRWGGAEAAVALLAFPVGLMALNAGVLPAGALALASSAVILARGAQTTQLTGFAMVWGALGLTWVSMRFAETATQWSWTSYARMRDLLEESRTQQLHLKEVQQDLHQANAELARVSDRLRAMNRIAEDARRAKEEFVANVSHELRTPLNMIIGFSEVITENPRLYDRDLPPQLLADIEVIQRNSRHLSALVNDVLDLSRAEAGRMALTREQASMHEIVETALATVRPLFQSKKLSLSMDAPDDLPPVYCDRTRIRQVVINLLSNAGRFTEHGGALVKVAQDGPSVIVTVSDTGPGIPKEDQERIFEPFEQYDGGTARAYGGSGLGLAISRRFVEMHGGRMWVDSEPGQGAAFSAMLPLEVTSHLHAGDAVRWFSPYQPYEPRTRPWQAPQPVVKPRLVVMEHSDTLRHILERYQPDVEVSSVRALDDAIQEIARLPARALLINEAPLTEGRNQVASAEHLPYRTPIIRCSIPDRQEAADQLGVTAYLLKPIEREALLSALETVGRPVRSVLLVDDNSEALQLFARILSSSGQHYDVYRASSGARALALLRARQPDVMLLDLVMPDMDGYEVLRQKQLDETICGIPVIAISALDTVPGGYTTSYVSVTRGGGINLQEFLRCAEALAAVLAPPDAIDAPEPAEMPSG